MFIIVIYIYIVEHLKVALIITDVYGVQNAPPHIGTRARSSSGHKNKEYRLMPDGAKLAGTDTRYATICGPRTQPAAMWLPSSNNASAASHR